MEKTENIVIGAGVTGITIAERLASRGENVLIIEKRETIGGNCYDSFVDGNYIQHYGPHIFHTNHEDVWKYLNKFTKFNNYKHKVLCEIDKNLVNIPFNLNSIEKVFDKEKARTMIDVLKKQFNEGTKIPILELLKSENICIKNLAGFIYKNVFLNYTVKQWGLKPDEIDLSITGRVPVIVSRNDDYFHDKYQGIPEIGFTSMLKKMLQNKNIRIILKKDYKSIIRRIYYKKVYYTGPLDYFFDYKFGRIKYRRIFLKLENNSTSSYQINSVINYPNTNKYTRITEFNKFLFINNQNSIIAKEYSSWYKGFLAYPLIETTNNEIIQKYCNEAQKLSKIKFVGRLAECKYFNIDLAIKRSLDLTNE